jgi:hypothetical protein
MRNCRFGIFFVHSPQRFYTPTSFGDNKSVRHRPAWTTARTATPMGTARGRQHGPVAVQAAGRHGASEAAAAYPNVALPGSKGSWMGLEGETQLSISIPMSAHNELPITTTSRYHHGTCVPRLHQFIRTCKFFRSLMVLLLRSAGE